ncbi:BZ3500_MvSof-1268-A1-R1_Chr6-1g08374 [Microbotryum saponariae]|uniref:BZ3500_MvSof-1268-A1-R1_Chr6-1g08374 protein n=1 Tax=Microbotryum saponariae TaxID=289078 RepID=A0A2X0KMD3_9BASI|nr:BZ3500_MvSof-1268-A1-R1_Chr6-1g08374 [Microbotryum saponariae]SDA07658.1 BZ3501_MvSof-1269-A2-R1_Chr6-1g08095 [Microbotryum saponariae]
MPAAKVEAATAEGLPTAVLDKYKAAGTVVSSAVQTLIAKCLEGANVLELCVEGDKLIEQGVAGLYNKVKGLPKGVAFPTSLSINSNLQNYNPLPSDKSATATTLAQNDVVKICLGAHIDGYAVVAAETIVIGSTPIKEVRADLLSAAHYAAEAALRVVKPGIKNWEITDVIKKVLSEYESVGVKGVEGVLSHQHEQNSIEAKKGIVAFPSMSQRADSDNAYLFEEGEVYGLNVLVTNGEKAFKTADRSATTIFSKTSTTYNLKMKTSRATFSEITKKAGPFPFTLRVLEEEAKARMGVKECVDHNLLKPYEVLTTDKTTDLSAQVFLTFALTKTGVTRLSLAPTWFSEDKVQGSVKLSEELKALVNKPLKSKPTKKKTTEKKADEEVTA